MGGDDIGKKQELFLLLCFSVGYFSVTQQTDFFFRRDQDFFNYYLLKFYFIKFCASIFFKIVLSSKMVSVLQYCVCMYVSVMPAESFITVKKK